ncbi:MAG: DUF2130 domain-containing protein [Candidatus Levybacteria bacterium]|nr:DUF2130 domain-containing protein [Candidatus Levybacteria bacterium]
MNTIICPSCGKQVQINQALKHEVEENIRQKVQTEMEEKLEKRLKEDLELKMKDAQNEREEMKKRNRELHDQILELNKRIRELLDQSEKRELENQRKLNVEIEKIKEEAQKFATEKAKLRELELEKKLSDTQKSLEEAQRKSRQGSQQLQGEVMELDLEESLKSIFVLDEFSPVPKGIEGADIWQKVKNKHGQTAGSILWEIKRTKAFSRGWLPKLREDARKVNASVCVLISEILPEQIKHFDRQEGVWVCSYDHAILLANVLRDGLFQVAIAKSSASHKDDKLQDIYDYITSEAFRHKIEGHFESVRDLKEDLDTEKRAMERIWKKREIQIQRLDKSTSQMFGELQGIAGPALPSIKSLEINSGDDDDNNETDI